jgi:diguanylate cyclase (GGDEF)-like protein
MAELSQRTLGYTRNVLCEMQPQEVYTPYELRDFWKQTLLDAGFPPRFVEIAAGYNFKWLDIIPDLHTGKFGPRDQSTSAYDIPPEIGEQILKKLVRFAVSEGADTPAGQQLVESLEADGFHVNATLQSDVPAELTKLPTKESLLRELAKQLQNGNLTSVMFIDLDNFKQVNDQNSHAEGDKCLIEVVKNIASAVASKGKVYRVGGDEFCVMLLNFSITEATATAERVRATIDGLRAFGSMVKVKVTASIGVAASDSPDSATAEELVDAADKAMYVAKHTTKNRVCPWPPEAPEAAAAEANRKKAGTIPVRNNPKLQMSLVIEGTPPMQALKLVANQAVAVSRVEYMLSNETTIASEDVARQGESVEIPINTSLLMRVWNTHRADRNFSDHSGPAKIAVTVSTDGEPHQYVLPVQMDRWFHNNAAYTKLVGSKTFYGS